LWGVIPGLIEAWRVVRRFQPDVLFSSGGYVSLPVVMAAWLQRVPIVIHEQTAAVGLANSVAGRLARQVAITFPQSAKYFKAQKVVVTGNPIQPEIIEPDLAMLQQPGLGQWLNRPGLPIIYVTGGGLGSHIINSTVEAALTKWLSQYRVVHQCGAHAGFNDYDRLMERSAALPAELQDRYYVAKHFSAQEVGLIYHQAALVVARAGANTVLELAAYGLPAVFIPIPWVTHDEQTQNAKVLVEAGTATIVPEKRLTVESLTVAIAQRLAQTTDTMAAKARAKALVDLQATTKLTEVVVAVGGGHRP
jgi:UDP-N-acetylglucosamine--N-acetylmuramyl-(pentapeptide) pyrophosphoryl-undecaprenol N-acetylglucosamine transferase